ncbi:MAG TPA: hypothetical protein VFZ53_10305, partial [Polyangiaceae bacterium]
SKVSSPMKRLVLLVPFAVACAAAPPPRAASPEPPGTASEGTSPPTAREPAARKPVAPAAVPPPPAECAALVQHSTSECLLKGGDTRAGLVLALAPNRAVAERDRSIACLEDRGGYPEGLLRALRAELAPVACADAIVAPVLEKPKTKLALEIENALLGLALSARLARLLGEPPRLEAPFSKERFLAFQKDELGPWIVAQALAIDQLSLQGSRLTGYGRGVAAIAAGNADLRFVEMARGIPLPDELRADKELTDVYYGSLDQALEPRKLRGRDAALVGLRAFAELGALHDQRVAEARTLLSKLWSGSRVDALDELIVPPLAAPEFSREAELAAGLPSFYASYVLAGEDASKPALLRAFLERGVPKALAASLDPKKLSPESRALLARLSIDYGRVYFRASDFRRAREALAVGKLDDGGRLLAALAQALERGPEDTAALMLKGPSVKGSFDVSLLDAIAKQNGPFAGAAAYDAAAILALVPRPNDATFWDDLALRFANAEKLLSQKKAPAEERERAKKYAEGARATARALRESR